MSPIEAPINPPEGRPAVPDPALDRLERQPGDKTADAGGGHQDAEAAGTDAELHGCDGQHESVRQPERARRDGEEHEDPECRVGGGIPDRLDEQTQERGTRAALGPQSRHHDDRHGEEQRGSRHVPATVASRSLPRKPRGSRGRRVV